MGRVHKYDRFVGSGRIFGGKGQVVGMAQELYRTLQTVSVIMLRALYMHIDTCLTSDVHRGFRDVTVTVMNIWGALTTSGTERN